jgi:mono/diheme cytochrome c family protein
VQVEGGRETHGLPDFPCDGPDAHRRFSRCLVCVAAITLAAVTVGAVHAEDEKPYQIVDGRVDAGTYNGFRRYNAVCNHCHGADGAGASFGPSLIATPLPFDDFRAAVLDGRGQGSFVMKGYAGDPNVEPYIKDIYAYLRARADGAIGRGRPSPIEQR